MCIDRFLTIAVEKYRYHLVSNPKSGEDEILNFHFITFPFFHLHSDHGFIFLLYWRTERLETLLVRCMLILPV